MQVNVYLHFDGQCRAAFQFYEKALGARTGPMTTYGNSPAAGQVSPDLRDKIMHATLTVGDQIIMGSDAPHEHARPPEGFEVSLSVTDPAEAEKLFNGLSENARVIVMPMQQTFWSAKFGMLVDQFGIPWMVNCTQAA